MAGQESLRTVLVAREPAGAARGRRRTGARRLSDPGALSAHRAPDEQHDDGADDRADETRRRHVERAAKEERRERAAHERADDPKDHRADPAHRVGSWNERARNEAPYESDDEEEDETHAFTSIRSVMSVTCAQER